jgi:transcription factor SFP1
VASSTHSTPPLHSPSGRESSAESSPISSPISTPPSQRHQSNPPSHIYSFPDPRSSTFIAHHHPEKSNDAFAQFTHADEFDCDDILFPDDAYNTGVVFAPESTFTIPHISIPDNATMPSPPITIATPRQPSNSPPRNQQSNLTSQLRQPQHDNDLDMDGIPNNEPKGRQESVSMLSTTPYGAKSIPVRDGMGFRRESHVGLSGSLMGGMSWGGLSMGSFVRDEYVLHSSCLSLNTR